jgi:DNA-binding transcriptional LysR family regulator
MNDLRRPKKAIELKHLRSALLASDCGSFRRAAELLSVRHSALSRSIAQLEHLIGATLFERSSGGIRPTELGRRFLPLASEILTQIDDLIDSTGAVAPGEAGRIAIGLCRPLPERGLQFSATLTEFRRRFPKIELEVIQRSPRGLLRCLDNRAADIVIAPGRLRTADMQTRALWTERIFVLLHKDNALAVRDVIFWTDLLDETVLFGGSEEKGELEHFLWSALPHFGNRPAIQRHDVNQLLVKNLVSLGLGVSFAWESEVGTFDEDVVYREFRDSASSIEACFSAHWLTRNNNTALARFLSLLVDHHPLLPSVGAVTE